MINERRNYFRIEDDVLFRYQTIDKSAAIANIIPAQFIADPSYSLMREIQAIDSESSKYLHVIAEQNHELEMYLRSISKKIDVIAAHIVEKTSPINDQKSQHISISEGGLSFHSDSKLPHDEFLAIQLSFLPSHQTVVLFAKIINCSSIESGGFSIAVSFVHLSDSDSSIVAKRIMQLQQSRKRLELSGE